MAHRRRRELYERIMNITSKPLSAYLPPQMNAALAYAPAEPATALPYTAGEVAAADDENPDPDGFYEKFVSQADIDAVFGKMKTPIGSYGASAFQQTESVDGAEQTVDSAEETEENIEAQAPDNGTTEGGDGNEE